MFLSMLTGPCFVRMTCLSLLHHSLNAQRIVLVLHLAMAKSHLCILIMPPLSCGIDVLSTEHVCPLQLGVVSMKLLALVSLLMTLSSSTSAIPESAVIPKACPGLIACLVPTLLAFRLQAKPMQSDQKKKRA